MKTLVLRSCIVLFLLSLSTAARAGQPLKDQTHLFELGVYGGVWIVPDEHELFDESFSHQPLKGLTGEFGLRAAYLPLPYLGVEAEVGVIPTSIDETGDHATVMAYRGHLLAQYPAFIAPFLVVGAGALQIRSSTDALGHDTDGVLHWGLGAKYYAAHWLALRIEGRHTLGSKLGEGGVGHYFEVFGGLTFVVGWDTATDTDGDGVTDEQDRCPDVPANTKDGCPPDSDGDGVTDDRDRCPEVPANTKDGCPMDTDGDGVTDDRDRCPSLPARTEDGCPADGDGDGVTDDRDRCPAVAASTPDGCPPPDTDGDGLVDSEDQCPNKPENKNGYQDGDGCPDTLPQAVQRFTGTIQGITFALNRAKIRRASYPTLDRAVAVLQEHGELRVIIRGHTDSRGKRERNMELSRLRAQAVKDYLVGKGIDEGRLQVEGLGPDEPVADNKTRRGRAKNRRIEFKLAVE